MSEIYVNSMGEFEERYGRTSVDMVLSTIEEEMWSPDSQQGIDISRLESLTQLGDYHRASGGVEFADVWFEFEILSGPSHGLEVVNFCSIGPVNERISDPLSWACYQSVQEMLASNPSIWLAARQTLAMLKKRFSEKRLSRQSRLFHSVLGAFLGDVAQQRQDYALEAVEETGPLLLAQSDAGSVRLFKLLTETTRNCVSQAAESVGGGHSVEQFFVQVMRNSVLPAFA